MTQVVWTKVTGAPAFRPFRRGLIVTRPAEPGRAGWRRTGMRYVTPSAAAGLVIVAGVLLSGCGGGSGTATGPAGGAAAAPPPGAQGRPAGPPGQAGPGSTGSTGSTGSSGSTARMLAAGADIVYTASMTVQVNDVSRAAARAATLAGQAGGYVSGEDASFRRTRDGVPSAAIQLKIPVRGYQATLHSLAGLGTQTSLRQRAADVTAQVADTASRAASDKAAITQLRTFLSRAGSISALLAVQAQINSQESALEAMQAQQRALDHETAYATVSLTLRGPKPHPARLARHRASTAGGFVGGITDGWKALTAVVTGLLTVLGAALPIGAACALAGYLGYRLLRGRRLSRPGRTRRAPGQ
jgi:hypothetical protein